MDKSTILAMEAGRALDGIIAEQIFGREVVFGEIAGRPEALYDLSPEQYKEGWLPHEAVPEYSTDISAAWLVVEKMRELDYFVSLKNYDNYKLLYQVKFYNYYLKNPDYVIGAIPEAICKAALITKLEGET